MNNIDLNCPYEQAYNVIICHNKEGLEFAKKKYGDYSNKLYLSDTGVEGTIDVSNGFPSSVYGELPFYHWIAQNLRAQDWARVNHYRRKLPLSIGLTLPAPLSFSGSMAQQLAYYHSPVLVEAIMRTLTPVEQQIFTTNNTMYAYNIMFAPVEFIQKVKKSLFFQDVLEILKSLEFAEDRGETDVGDFVDGGEDIEDGFADLATGDLIGAIGIEDVGSAVDDVFDFEFRVKEFPDTATDSEQKLVTVVDFFVAATLGDGELRHFDALVGGKTMAIFGLATTPYHVAINGLAAF